MEIAVARKPYVGGNWKMNLHQAEALALAEELAKRLPASAADITVFPALPYLLPVAQVLASRSSAIRVGAQDFYFEKNGAFTGEISLSMLQDVGASVALVGHSERRHVIGESDLLINQKVLAALEAGLDVVLCIGETLDQREKGMTDSINAAQLNYGLAGVSAQQMSRVTIAYEPVWAIGTGKTATPQDAQNAHRAIRDTLCRGLFDDPTGQAVRIQYGGSVKPANAADLFSQDDIDGGLIGGASLKADDFVPIVEAAAASAA